MCGGNGNKPTGKPVVITLSVDAEALYTARPTTFIDKSS